MNGGNLYIVGTPIGNLEDITQRALRILKDVDIIASEDTRRTRVLLEHYGIRKKMVSYNEHNSKERTEELLTQLKSGKNIALVSDAGTPCISDPGSYIVKRAREEGFKVIPLPGPSSVITALSVSGLNFRSFLFSGFLPDRSNARAGVFENWRMYDHPVVFFESPHRIINTIDEIIELFPDSHLIIFREITKVHEEVIEGRPEDVRRELLKKGSIKGELIGIISINNKSEQSNILLKEVLSELLDTGWTKEEIKNIIGVLKNASRNEIYREFLRLKEGG